MNTDVQSLINEEVILKDFDSRLANTGLVSRSDVLSVESLLGNSLFTGTRTVNYFSNSSSPIGVNELRKEIAHRLVNNKTQQLVTVSDIIRVAKEVNVLLMADYTMLFENALCIKPEIIERLSDPKYTNRYSDDELKQIYRIDDMSLVKAAYVERDYVKSIFDLVPTTTATSSDTSRNDFYYDIVKIVGEIDQFSSAEELSKLDLVAVNGLSCFLVKHNCVEDLISEVIFNPSTVLRLSTIVDIHKNANTALENVKMLKSYIDSIVTYSPEFDSNEVRLRQKQLCDQLVHNANTAEWNFLSNTISRLK